MVQKEFLNKVIIGLPKDATKDIKEVEGKISWRTMSWAALDWLALLHTIGDTKYYPGNWQLCEPSVGIKRYSDALARHFKEWMKGSVIDEDTSIPHIVQVMWNAEVVTHFLIEGGFIDELDSDLSRRLINEMKRKKNSG